MRIFFWLLLLLPLIEIFLLIKVGSEVGALAMVLWIILSAIAGVFCIRMAGVATALSARERMARGERPDAAMLTGLLWVVGGVLLFIPGLLSDVLGLLCILPLSRHWLVRRMGQGGPQTDIPGSYQRTYEQHEPGRQHSQVIEGEFERKEKD